MTGTAVSRWSVAEEDEVRGIDVDESGSLSDAALEKRMLRLRDLYVGRCPTLAATLTSGTEQLVHVLRRRSRGRIALGASLGGLTVIEVRPSTFDMALRVRTLGGEVSWTVDAVYEVHLEDQDGTPQPVPRWLRDELITAETAAAEYC